MKSYGVQLVSDGDTILVTCPSFPEVASVGDDKEEALLEVVDAIVLAIECRIADREKIPAPVNLGNGLVPVHIPAMVMIKAELHNEMLAQGVRKSELARRLGIHMPQVDRLLNPKHSTKLETLELAFEKLGKHLALCIA